LMLELLDKRDSLPQHPKTFVSVRGLLGEMRSTETAVQWQGTSTRVDAEVHIIRNQIKTLQSTLTAQTKLLSQLESDQDIFRSTMNQRLEFYRQLQDISDTVKPYREELGEVLDLAKLQSIRAQGVRQDRSLASLKSKQRFLLHLRDEANNEAQRICVICQCEFEQGVLTVCGHQYCKECIKHWWSQHRTCPVCKRSLRSVDFHDITYKPQELRAQQEDVLSQASPTSDGSREASSTGTSDAAGVTTPSSSLQAASIYSGISPQVLDEIKSIELPTRKSYGTKIDTIARHLLYLRNVDPGCKAVIFSQFREFLDVLSSALETFRISHVRLSSRQSDAVQKFKSDPSIECFLLDAKTDSSGLNLTNATYVFLCEPLINTAIELQAIARVHRIGQRRPTSVFMYIIRDSVEEGIYNLSVKRRLEHVSQTSAAHKQMAMPERSRSTTPMPGAIGEAAVDAANSKQLQGAVLGKLLTRGKEGGGEIVPNDDLWTCLFGSSTRNKITLAGNGRSSRPRLDLMSQDASTMLTNSEAGSAASGSAGALSAEVGRFMRTEAAQSRMHG